MSRRPPRKPAPVGGPQENWAPRIHAELSASTHPPMADELVGRLSLPPAARRAFRRALAEMIASGEVILIKGGRLALPARVSLLTGRFRLRTDGFGAVTLEPRPGATSEGERQELLIPPALAKGAMHGDLVAVRPEGRGVRGRPSGAVAQVLERAHKQLVGVLERRGEMAFIRPSDPRLGGEVAVPRGGTGRARDGQVVVADMVEYPTGAAPGQGKVSEVLGFPGDPGVETASVVHAHGLPARFPAEVARQAESIPEPGPADLAGRVDLRSLPLVTIDGEKARDFDDALAAFPQPDGTTRLLVAIADVSHFVLPGTPLDREAARRGNSVYFPDLVVPMLPERLSNGLCSLVPGEDRLAFACEAFLAADGTVLRHRFLPAVIKSAARLTYPQAQRFLDGETEAIPAPARESLRALAETARTLAAVRRAAGSLDFDLPEPDITLDMTTGAVEAIARAERLFTHRLVEECMLLANRLAAGDLLAAGVEAVYRVHEPPMRDSVEELNALLGPLGHHLPPEPSPSDFAAVLATAAGTVRERFLNTVVLRSLKRAVYTTRPLGHFGLALAHYTHFTSPIRRYADLLVHRLHRHLLDPDRLAPPRELEAVCEAITGTEGDAAEAEREVVSALRARFMEDKVGEEYAGVISGVASFGFFVELADYFVEGLVRLSSLGDDYYVFRDQELALAGEHSGRTFRLGDPVRVVVARVDVARRHIDFALAGEKEKKPSGRRGDGATGRPGNKGTGRPGNRGTGRAGKPGGRTGPGKGKPAGGGKRKR